MTAPPFRVLVTGSRRIIEVQIGFVCGILAHICAEPLFWRKVVIVQGECPYGGVDLAAQKWAETHPHPNMISESHPASWDRYGKGAGMRRNAEMVAAGADICVAFPANTSRGTWDCIRKAADAGIPVRIYPLGPVQ